MGKTLFYIICFCVWDVSELTRGSLNEMLTQIHLLPNMQSKTIPSSCGSWRCANSCENVPECYVQYISIVASGLMTTGNYCHSCQLWDKMRKLCPTFTFFPENYLWKVLFDNTVAFLILPSLAMQPNKPPNKIIFFCTLVIYSWHRKTGRGSRSSSTENIKWNIFMGLCGFSLRRTGKKKIKRILYIGYTLTLLGGGHVLKVNNNVVTCCVDWKRYCWGECVATSLVLYLCANKNHYLLFCNHFRHEDFEGFKHNIVI